VITQSNFTRSKVSFYTRLKEWSLDWKCHFTQDWKNDHSIESVILHYVDQKFV
jgi:hypothetical protein